MATLEQKRAQHAWEKAAEGIRSHGSDYMNDAKGLPALIMNSGLMQVMAFLRHKGWDAKKREEKRQEMLARHLRDWLHQQLGTPRGFEAFMEEMMQANSHKYQQVTTEAFAWLRWLRQMAAARNGGNG